MKNPKKKNNLKIYKIEKNDKQRRFDLRNKYKKDKNIEKKGKKKKETLESINALYESREMFRNDF